MLARRLPWRGTLLHVGAVLMGGGTGFVLSFVLLFFAYSGHGWPFVVMGLTLPLAIPVFFLDLGRSADRVASGTGAASFARTVFTASFSLGVAWPLLSVIQ